MERSVWMEYTSMSSVIIPSVFLFKQFCFCHFVFYVKWSHESMMTTVGCLFWKQQKWILKKKSFCANTKTVSNVFRSIESLSLDIVPKVFLSIGLAKRAFFPLFSARYKTNVYIAILFCKTLINKQKMKKKMSFHCKKKIKNVSTSSIWKVNLQHVLFHPSIIDKVT